MEKNNAKLSPKTNDGIILQSKNKTELSALLRGTTSRGISLLYLLKTLKISEFSQSGKYDKEPFIIHVDLECNLEKIDGCKNNPENSSTTKASERISPGFSMPAISSFRSIANKYDVYRGKDCMKKFCKFLREHAMKIINLKNEFITKRLGEIV